MDSLSPEFLLSIIEELPEMIVRLDSEGGVNFVNRAYCEAFGVRSDEVLGKPFSIPVHSEDTPVVKDGMARFQKDREGVRFWNRTHTANGLRWHTWTFRHLDDGGAQGSGHDFTDLRAIQDEMAVSRTQIRALAQRLLLVHEEERRQLAREIHDGLGQSLTILTFAFSALIQSLDLPPGVARDVDEISGQIEQIIWDARSLSRKLRPRILDDLGLPDAIQSEVEGFRQRTLLPVAVHVSPADLETGAGQATALFRILQESLNNIERHARASLATVRLERHEGSIVLTVTDNGCGICKERIGSPSSFGLVGIRERAAAWGGSVSIESGPGQGTAVRVELPCTEAERPVAA